MREHGVEWARTLGGAPRFPRLTAGASSGGKMPARSRAYWMSKSIVWTGAGSMPL